MATQLNRETANINKRKFLDFLQFDFPNGSYEERIRSMLERGDRRLVININDLRTFDPNLVRGFLLNPSDYIPPFEDALKSEVARVDQTFSKEAETEYFIGVEGSFGSHHVSPRGLSSSFIRNLVCVEGIVTKCSLVRPKVIKSVHYCEKTQQLHTRTYQDSTSSVGAPTPTAYPTKDENGNPLVTEYGMCVYKDSQMISIQEMPERAPPGQLPRSVDIILENDLVDRLKPGDRVQVVGVYRALPSVQGQTARGVFRTILQANHIRTLTREACGPVLTEQDIQNIRQLAKRDDAFELLASSLAPSVSITSIRKENRSILDFTQIYGHEFIKKSLLLLLLGGVERNLDTGTHLRGDINVLLVGDPSTAKSQLLRFVLHIAPLAISTSGRGSSGVGLTAAVTSDSETGERRLEAGAMVLADRGVVCIDEFDKMSVDDRVAIHEVMEQQTVTIAKAGIHTTLNARCSVVAAANPVYGKYNKQKKPTENIGLPDSLLSRFDLLFIVLDNLNPTSDRDISDHVLRMHRYRRPGEYDGEATQRASGITDLEEEEPSSATDAQVSTPVMQPFDRLLHGSDKKRGIFRQQDNRIKPKLTQEAKDFITNAYTDLRAKEDMKTLPVTARTLETMIRLATAHAKCNLSTEVRIQDAEVALDLMRYALYHDTRPVPQKPTAGVDSNPSVSTVDTDGAPGSSNGGHPANDTVDTTNDVDEDDSSLSRKDKGKRPRDENNDNDSLTKKSRTATRAQSKPTSTSTSSKSKSSKAKTSTKDPTPSQDDVTPSTPLKPSAPFQGVTEEREQEFMQTWGKLMRKKKVHDMPIADIAKEMPAFSRDEIEAIVIVLNERNKVLYQNSVVHLL